MKVFLKSRVLQNHVRSFTLKQLDFTDPGIQLNIAKPYIKKIN